jgi:hypothetical protein
LIDPSPQARISLALRGINVVGNAVTYRYLVKGDLGHAFEAATLLKNRARSFL